LGPHNNNLPGAEARLGGTHATCDPVTSDFAAVCMRGLKVNRQASKAIAFSSQINLSRVFVFWNFLSAWMFRLLPAMPGLRPAEAAGDTLRVRMILCSWPLGLGSELCLAVLLGRAARHGGPRSSWSPPKDRVRLPSPA